MALGPGLPHDEQGEHGHSIEDPGSEGEKICKITTTVTIRYVHNTYVPLNHIEFGKQLGVHGLGLTNELPDVPHEYEAQGEDSLKIGTSQAVSSLLYTYSIQ